jgi:RNA polymerase sigma-70 factor (ECF subfamily)
LTTRIRRGSSSIASPALANRESNQPRQHCQHAQAELAHPNSRIPGNILPTAFVNTDGQLAHHPSTERDVVMDWERIVREHGPMVFRTAWKILGHAADAEDTVQEVFLEAWRMRPADAVDNWGGMLRRVATYRALDRRRGRRPTAAIDDLSLSGGDGPDDLAIGRELAERLREAVARLPQREGAVFCLRHFEELSYQQIADTLDTTTGAVAAALYKARARLEAELIETAAGE